MLKHYLFLLATTFFLAALSARDYKKVALQTYEGKYVTADQSHYGAIRCNSPHIFEWETFKLHKTNTTTFTLSENFNKPIYFNQDSILIYGSDQNASTFTIKKKNGRNYLFTNDSSYVSCNQNKLVKTKDASKGIIIHFIDNRNIFDGVIKNSGIVLIGIAIILYLILFYLIGIKKSNFKDRYVFMLILFSNICIGLFAATQTDFLGLWDEQYHALVGKNLATDFLPPKLYRIDLFTDKFSWTASHIWLHKQPIFLFQMAISIALFGANELAVRLPSIILLALSAFGIYRMGKLIFSQKIGLFASWLFMLSGYKSLLLMGFKPTDHNDLVFLAYVLLSFWTFIEYYYDRNKKYLLYLIGLFSAFAILTKWLTGLLVYLFILFVYLLTNKPFLRAVISYVKLIYKPLALTVLLVLSWQVYIHTSFPEMAAHEASLISAHFTEVIEGHFGGWNFHLLKLKDHYGLSYTIIGFLVAFALFSKRANHLKVSMFLSIAFVIIFFSLAVTKMESFIFVLAPFIFLFFAEGLKSSYDFIEQRSSKKMAKGLVFISAVFISYHSFNLPLIQELFIKNRGSKHFSILRTIETQKIKSTQLDEIENTVIFNCRPTNEVLAMFYLDVAQAYGFIPSKEQLNVVLEKGYNIAIYYDPMLPDYILNNNKVTILPNY